MGKQRTFRTPYFTFNIKYFTQNEIEDRYSTLIQKLFEADLKVKVHSDKYIFIRRLQLSSDKKFFYGTFSRATKVEGDWIDTITKEIVTFNVPPELYANAKEVDFVFIPDCHRLCLRRDSAFSHNVIHKFLEVGLGHIVDSNSELIINVETSEDILQRIYDAQRIKSLEVLISYTNDDFGDEFEEWMDEELKDSRISNFHYNAKPDSSGNINVNSRLIKGTLALSKNNGNAIARIVNSDNKTETIKTVEHPKIDHVQLSSDSRDTYNFAKALAIKLLALYRPTQS